MGRIGRNIKETKKIGKSKPVAYTLYVEGFGTNNLFGPPEAFFINDTLEMKPLKIKEVLKGLPDKGLDTSILEGHNEKIERNIKKKYNEYLTAYKKFYEDDNYDKEDALNEKGGTFTAANWGVKATAINKN